MKAGRKIPLPQELLDLHPDLSWREIKAIAAEYLKRYGFKVRNGYILDFRIAGIGRVKSHGNRVVRRVGKYRMKDRKRKRERQIKKEFSKKHLLW